MVDAFLQVLDREPADQETAEERILNSAELREGMVLSRDLLNQNGMLLLGKDRCLTQTLIERIKVLENLEKQKHMIGVYTNPAPK